MDTTETAEAFSNHPSPPPGDAAASDLPRLPPPDPDSNLRSIRLGETIRFEEYGPIILNKDGSTRRISNWDVLTDQEKEVSWRRISKRNEERRAILLEELKEKEAREQQQTDDGNNAKEL